MRPYRPSPLLRELHQATLLARRPAVAAALRACGLPTSGNPVWGICGVSAGPEFYQPDDAGVLAAIVPAVEGPEDPYIEGPGTEGPGIVDLVACSLATRAMRTRRGIAAVLGHARIDDAVLGNQPLNVYDDALSWLRGGCRGVVVLDWQAAPLLLREVPALTCESRATAERLGAAFERPRPYPPILVHHGERR